MERKIGEIFEYNGEWYQCIESDSCGECSLRMTECGSGTKSNLAEEVFGECSKIRRSDSKHVIFKKLEKVGEPFTSVGKLYQHYKVFDIDNVYGDVFWCVHNYKAKTLTIEIKQNKEDMGENKLNLKPFDLQKAKEGKPVCTRDGRKARIICFDKRGEQPIVSLIEKNEEESIDTFFNNGHSVSKTNEVAGDLMMLPEKKEGWINVYKGGLLDTKSYNTKKEAFDKASPRDYVDTVKINWSE